MNGRLIIRIPKKNFSYSTLKDENSNKIFFKINNEIKSFWHDIPLKYENNIYNMVIEIPSKSPVKMEMNKNELLNPLMIKYPKKSQKPPEYPIRERDYSKDPNCNYGFFPQTYSSKTKKYRNIFSGDADPLDVIDMGGPFNYEAGDIIQVKVLGSFCLIDEGEADWKIVVSNIKSNSSKQALEEPIKDMMYWFKIFKSFLGKKENEILDDNRFFDVDFTNEIIQDGFIQYKKYLENPLLNI